MATVAHTQTRTTGADGATYTFTGGTALAIGADGGSDLLILCFGGRSTATATGVSALTVDGVNVLANAVVAQGNDGGGGGSASITTVVCTVFVSRNALPDPTQTDVDASITFNASMIRCAVDVFVSPDAALTGYYDTPVTDTGWNTDTLVLTQNVPAGGISVGCIYTGDTAAYTWTGMTEQTDTTVGGEGNQWGTGFVSNASAGTPRTMTIGVVPAAGGTQAAIGVVFAQASAGTSIAGLSLLGAGV